MWKSVIQTDIHRMLTSTFVFIPILKISSLHHPHVLHPRSYKSFRYLWSSSRYSHNKDEGENAFRLRRWLPGTNLFSLQVSSLIPTSSLKDLIARFTLDSASEFLFGVNIGSLSNDLPYPHNAPAKLTSQSNLADDFATAFGKAQFVASQRARIGWQWPLYEIFEDKTAKHMEVVNAFLWVNDD